jgi:hypothetical protein
MAFDFPASPAEGQIFNAPGGPTYVFNSPVWKAVGQGQIAVISDTAPSNPANGALWYESDTGILYIWYVDPNSAQWVQVGGIAATGSIVERFYTASGTWTKPAGLRFLEVEVVGAGGGGGGAGATTAADYSAGAGGGGGGYAKIVYAAAALSASHAYTIGAAGLGQSGANGTNGGTTTFNTISGGGGFGGQCLPTRTTMISNFGGQGGSGSGGTVNGMGKSGTGGATITASARSMSGDGGASIWGSGGVGTIFANNSAGNDGIGYGGGGGGAANAGAFAIKLGGNGIAGAIYLKEIY